MPPPKDRKQWKSFLGMISYYSCFVSGMRQIRGPLDDLEKDEKFKWMEIHHSSFEKLKKVLQPDLLLTHFDPEMNIIIAADASDYGLGAVISHQFAGGQEKSIAHIGIN